MPFPLLALAAPMIAQAGGALFSKLLSRPSAEQKQATANSNALFAKSMGKSDELAQEATRNRTLANTFLSRTVNNLSAPTNLFQSLLSGNSDRTTSALAPQLQAGRDATRTALQTSTSLTPRGGARSSTLFDLPFKQAAAGAAGVNDSRNSAASGLMQVAGINSQLGSDQARLGAGYDQLSTDALRTAAAPLNTSTQQANYQQTQANQQGAQFARFLGPMIDKVDWAKIFKAGRTPTVTQFINNGGGWN